MKSPDPPFDPANLVRLPIASVERETGLGKETLRVWERRYGFPRPERDATGERAYSGEEVEKLRLVKRLLDAGHRPGSIVRLPIEELGRIYAGTHVAREATPEVEHCLALLKAHAPELLRQRLLQFESDEGLMSLVVELLTPLGTRVGDAWMRGDLQVFSEHAYAEMAQGVVRQAIARHRAGTTPRPPRVLLSTFPGEPHGLGLLMAEALLAVSEAESLSLGVQTPVWDLASAAVAYRCDVVAIGFSGSMNPNHVVQGLTELRAKLPASVALWAGGTAPVLHRRRVPGVLPVAAPGDVGQAVAQWRAGADGFSAT